MNTTIILKANLLSPKPAANPRRKKEPTQTQLRAYRRALRAAEQAAWEAGEPRPAKPSATPGEQPDHPLALVGAILVMAALMALVFGLKSVGDAELFWTRFVDFVRATVG